MNNPSYCNIHDYLDSIGAQSPPVDPKTMEFIKSTMIICDSVEEVVDTLTLLDSADDILDKTK